jgi:hypothetical protein
MEHAPLSDALKQFLVQAIGTVERLDILLLMQRHADRWWTAKALGEQLRMPATLVETELGVLGSHNLTAVRIAQDVLYQFSPGTPALRQLMNDLAQAYYADRTIVVAMVAAPISEGARLFADAFRLRKGKEDG